MRGRSSEIVETITRRNIDLCCVQEVRWRGASTRYLTGKDSRYKFFWIGNDQGTNGVGVLLAEKWVDKLYDIRRVSDRIMLGIDEWIVRFVQTMYHNTKSRVRVNNTFTDEFGVKVGVHQGSVLSPLLFIIVLKALSCEFRTGTPWELLYADDLVIVAETEEDLRRKLTKWKAEMEEKGLRKHGKDENYGMCY